MLSIANIQLQGIPGTINEKREALERLMSKLEVLIKHSFCWRMPLPYQSCNTYWEHSPLTYVERSCASSTGLFFYSLGRVANVSLEEDECKQAGFPVNFGGLGCRWEQKKSGAWLNALLVSSLGTLLDSNSFRVAIALRVGYDDCIPHSCRCGGRMDSRGLHGLSCKYSAGRFPRHSAMNGVVKRALQKAGLP